MSLMNKFSLSFLFLLLLCCGRSNATPPPAVYAPYFNGGAVQYLNVCQNSGANDINTILRVTDSSVGETETWSALLAPTHGSLAAAYTTSSTGLLLTPTGMSYTPTAGYFGVDSFSVVVTDGTQRDTTMVYLIVNEVLSGVTIVGPSAVCVGSIITLSAPGTAGLWSASNGHATAAVGSVAGISAGLDTIRYIATNICGSDTVYSPITVNDVPHAGTITGNDTVCVGMSLSLSTSGDTGGIWSSSTTNAGITTTGSVTGVAQGLTNVIYTITNLCGTTADTFLLVVVNCATGIGNPSTEESSLQIAPNPSTGVFTLTLSSATKENAQVVISNMLGQKVSEFAVATNTANEVKLNVPASVYMLSATVNGQQLTSRIVVTE